MHSLIPFLADDIAAQRRADAIRQAIASSVAASNRSPRATIRRRLALALAAVSRASAGAAHRLDGCLADDLASQLAPGR